MMANSSAWPSCRGESFSGDRSHSGTRARQIDRNHEPERDKSIHPELKQGAVVVIGRREGCSRLRATAADDGGTRVKHARAADPSHAVLAVSIISLGGADLLAVVCHRLATV